MALIMCSLELCLFLILLFLCILGFFPFFVQISESTVKDLDSVFEGLQWDILKESGYMSWYGLACTLGTYLRCHCSKEDGNSVLEKKGLSTMKVHVDLVFE